MKFVQGLLSEHANKQAVIQGIEDYEHAFQKFVDAHETYLRFQCDEGMRHVANESYKTEKKWKLLLEVELSTRKFKVKHHTKGISKSVHKSHRLSKTGRRSSGSSLSSVREKQRLFEEACLKVEALEQRQTLGRQLEEREDEFKKRELEIPVFRCHRCNGSHMVSTSLYFASFITYLWTILWTS